MIAYLCILTEWTEVMSKLRKLNRFKSKDRKFARMFQKGATKIKIDSSGRLLLPKGLLGWAGIKKEIVIVANGIYGRYGIKPMRE